MAAGGHRFHSVPGRRRRRKKKKLKLEIVSKRLNVTSFMVERRSCQEPLFLLNSDGEEGEWREGRRRREGTGWREDKR